MISKVLIGSYKIYDKFISVNNMFREYHEMNEDIKSPETFAEYTI